MARDITVTLTAYNMGEAISGEADFDAWRTFVDEHIDEVCRFTVNVDSHPFADGPAEDTITGASDAGESVIRDALETLWERFCATPEAWPKAS